MRLAVSRLSAIPGLGIQILSGRGSEEIKPALGDFSRVEYIAPATLKKMLELLNASPGLIALFESGLFKAAQNNWAGLAAYL